jgi:hypothetical protein
VSASPIAFISGKADTRASSSIAAQFVLAASPIIDAGREDDVMRESSVSFSSRVPSSTVGVLMVLQSFSTRRSSHSWSHRRDVESKNIDSSVPDSLASLRRVRRPS